MPPCGRKPASTESLVLTRSGWPGVELTMRASGAPWTRVRWFRPSDERELRLKPARRDDGTLRCDSQCRSWTGSLRLRNRDLRGA